MFSDEVKDEKCLKEFSIRDLEEFISKAISEATAKPYEASINGIAFVADGFREGLECKLVLKRPRDMWLPENQAAERELTARDISTAREDI